MNAPHSPSNSDANPDINVAQPTNPPAQGQSVLVTDKRAERERVETVLAAKDAEAEAAHLFQMQEYAQQQRPHVEAEVRAELLPLLRRESERLERERAERRRLEEKIGTLQDRIDHLERTEVALREGIAYLQGEVAVRDHQLVLLYKTLSGRAVKKYWHIRANLSSKAILSTPYRAARAVYHRLLPFDQRTAIRRALKKRGIG